MRQYYVGIDDMLHSSRCFVFYFIPFLPLHLVILVNGWTMDVAHTSTATRTRTTSKYELSFEFVLEKNLARIR